MTSVKFIRMHLNWSGSRNLHLSRDENGVNLLAEEIGHTENKNLISKSFALFRGQCESDSDIEGGVLRRKPFECRQRGKIEAPYEELFKTETGDWVANSMRLTEGSLQFCDQLSLRFVVEIMVHLRSGIQESRRVTRTSAMVILRW